MNIDGTAVVYCDGAFGTPNGKTAHGLVRFTRRYDLLCVIDARHAGRLAADVVVGARPGIRVVATLDEAIRLGQSEARPATHFVVGLAPDGGRLPAAAREVVENALKAGLAVDSGLHDFLGEDRQLADLASRHGVRIRDVRRPPDRDSLHFFSGVIEKVGAKRIALLGTDSAVGKRTTAWLLVDALNARGRSTELVGTGQTAWMQGARYGIVLDSLINDFVSGEIEHAVHRAWEEVRPDYIILEGQGSLMNPAYPGGFELLAAGRPSAVVLQHAPGRRDYDGFPGYPLHPLEEQIRAIEVISGVPVVAITVNHEGLEAAEVPAVCEEISREHQMPCVDPLLMSIDPVVDRILEVDGRAR
jgi:uncharacterized NAD-dependent epimerase/dehydratase family protein